MAELPTGMVAVKLQPRNFGPSQYLLDIKDGRVLLALGSNGPGPTQGYQVLLSPAEAAKLGQQLARAAFQLGGS